MPYEEDYKMWLEKMLIEMNPDWICDGMHDIEFTHDWCYKYCGTDNVYITPKCLHMYYHHIARAEQTEPQREHRDCINCESADDCAKCRGITDEPQTEVETMSCQECKHWIFTSRWGWFCPLKGKDECNYEPIEDEQSDIDWKDQMWAEAVEQREHDILYEPTYNEDDGSM